MSDMTPERTDPPKIIPLNSKIEATMEISRKAQERKHKCHRQHRHVTVDEVARTLTCDDCGYVIDPFEYVLQWAVEGENRLEALKRIEIQLKVNEAENADLEKKIKAMRVSLKRGGSPQPQSERHEYDMIRWNPRMIEEGKLDELRKKAGTHE